MKDLIDAKETRCNDYRCPIGGYCARFKQIQIDIKKEGMSFPTTNYNGYEKRRLCDNFLNTDNT